MSKQMYCDPNPLPIPAGGGTGKFRLKNPDTRKFMYLLEITNPNLYTIDMPPLGTIPMGENKVVTVTRKAGPPGDDKLIFKYYDPPANPHDFEIPPQPLGTFECKLVAK